ncbi:MAG: hypothetical protein LBV41_07605 [Cytophagaceae bacterium]|jgi:hypothetical protein|nr:hypothetical protein [Cytophagaceae bacterium]
MKNKISIGTVFSEGIANGLKNFPSLLGAVILWLLTILIPYINVGTTIAISTIPLMLSKGEVINPLFIFNKRYHRYMGEYFLTNGLRFTVILMLMPTFIFTIPAIVIGMAWSMATLLVLDKGLNATEALRVSNKITYGNKWTIFLIYFLLVVGAFILGGILSLIPFIGTPLAICVFIAFMPVVLACEGVIYGMLSKDVEALH